MKSERVTQAWEFYRDNCQGFKESMRQEFRKLDEYVSVVEFENAKLRELARYHVGAVEDCGCCHCPYYEDADCQPETEPMREGCRLYAELRLMGVEVEE